MTNGEELPIALSTIQADIFSAKFWTGKIQLYSAEMQNRADYFAIAATILSTITGLTVWATLATSTQWPIVLFTSIVAIISAVVSFMPKNRGYGECATTAASLGPRYSHALGELENVLEILRVNINDPKGQTFARQAVKEFEEVKVIKDALKPFPAKLQKEINDLRSAGNVSIKTSH